MRRNIGLFHSYHSSASQFFSNFTEMGFVSFPDFTNTRVMMMPIVIGDTTSIPPVLKHYTQMIKSIFDIAQARYHGQVGYVTIDESHVEKGKTHRRPGLHVDGIGGWGGPGTWGGSEECIAEMLRLPINTENKYHYGPGMFLMASHSGCVAWRQTFKGEPGSNGECGHLVPQCEDKHKRILDANRIYWLNPMCVHAATEMPEETPRQLLRLSMPSNAPWFDEYTPNPLGVQPGGPIIKNARASYMNFRPK